MYQPKRSGLSWGTAPALVKGASATHRLDVHALCGVEELLFAQLHPHLHLMVLRPIAILPVSNPSGREGAVSGAMHRAMNNTLPQYNSSWDSLALRQG